MSTKSAARPNSSETKDIRLRLDIEMQEMATWTDETISISQFDFVLNALQSAIKHTNSEWDPQQDPSMKECFLKLRVNVSSIWNSHYRETHTAALRNLGWKLDIR